MKLAPYWLDSAPAFDGGAQGPVEGKVDVAVIGGGFTGLSAALALVRRGASVAVLEADRVGGGASGRNGGHCNNGFSPSIGAVAARHGKDRAVALYRAFDAAVDTVERLVADEGIDCDFVRTGKIKLAVKPKHYDAMARSLEGLLHEADPEAFLVPPERVREEVGSAAYHGGVVMPKSAQMHVGRFGQGLAVAAARRARIYEGARVTALRRGDGAHRLTTSRGTLQAQAVLLASGASPEAPLYFRRRIIPIGSFIIATAPLSDDQARSVMPTRRNAVTSAHVGHYFRLTADNRLIFGGRTRFALPDPRSDAVSGRLLERQLRNRFPQIADVAITHCWGGLVDLTTDRLPRCGEYKGLHYAMGYSGHGVQMSVEMGQRMAAIMSGERVDNPLGTLSWPAIPGHFGPPWFLPLVGAWYRLKDALG